ncbi:MAG: AAA family ATPase, partial [candidate division Zixibacteria bacterium]|nr:AAA family ATPase [candidate division Zixibacteria bacterium]
MAERITTPKTISGEAEIDVTLRPTRFTEFVGQTKVVDNLKVFIQAARQREEALDHVLFYGPPGLGKTTLAHVITAELGVGIKATSGPILERAADLAGILTNLKERDCL